MNGVGRQVQFDPPGAVDSNTIFISKIHPLQIVKAKIFKRLRKVVHLQYEPLIHTDSTLE